MLTLRSADKIRDLPKRIEAKGFKTKYISQVDTKHQSKTTRGVLCMFNLSCDKQELCHHTLLLLNFFWIFLMYLLLPGHLCPNQTITQTCAMPTPSSCLGLMNIYFSLTHSASPFFWYFPNMEDFHRFFDSEKRSPQNSFIHKFSNHTIAISSNIKIINKAETELHSLNNGLIHPDQHDYLQRCSWNPYVTDFNALSKASKRVISIRKIFDKLKEFSRASCWT